MRTSWILLLIALAAMPAGCKLFDVDRDAFAVAVDPRVVEQIQTTDRIIISYGSRPEPNTYLSIHWMLEAGGNCTCDFTRVSRGQLPKVEKYDVPPATFEEARRLLVESKVWLTREYESSYFDIEKSLMIDWLPRNAINDPRDQAPPRRVAFKCIPKESHPLVKHLEQIRHGGAMTPAANRPSSTADRIPAFVPPADDADTPRFSAR